MQTIFNYKKNTFSHDPSFSDLEKAQNEILCRLIAQNKKIHRVQETDKEWEVFYSNKDESYKTIGIVDKSDLSIDCELWEKLPE